MASNSCKLIEQHLDMKIFAITLMTYLPFAVFYAKFESSVKWAYGALYWTFFTLFHVGLQLFLTHRISVYVSKGKVTKKMLIKTGLITTGVLMGMAMLEDFLAVYFANLFSLQEGIKGSVAGVPYFDPDYGYYVPPALPTGYLEINGFTLPWAYLYFPSAGIFLIFLGTRIKPFSDTVNKIELLINIKKFSEQRNRWNYSKE